MKKKILHLDMDGVVADFDKAVNVLCPELKKIKDPEIRHDTVERTCLANPKIFHHLEPIKGAHSAVSELFDLFEIYFLSTPMWCVPESFTGKRIWVEDHFGTRAKNRLILTHRKDLAIGDYLVDDRIKHGVDKFTGKHIHFGTKEFPDWKTLLPYLKSRA